MNALEPLKPTPVPRLPSLSHDSGYGCKIALGVMSEILKNSSNLPGFNLPPELLVGIETADPAMAMKSACLPTPLWQSGAAGRPTNQWRPAGVART